MSTTATTPTQPPVVPNLQVVADEIAKQLSADVMIYTGRINEHGCTQIESLCSIRNQRKNVVLILATVGGDPHAAFRIARCLGARYPRVESDESRGKFIVYVPTRCKSAGTLLCVGADELVIWNEGQLGPLDVQFVKRDELDEQGSGLDLLKTMEYLEERAIGAFDKYLKQIKENAPAISTASAAQMATSLTVGLHGELFKQIDPLYLGEVSRAMAIAIDYGERLSWRGRNFRVPPKVALEFLATGYSSHSFVVDREEASAIFKKVREPDLAELLMLLWLSKRCADVASKTPFVQWVDELPEYKAAAQETAKQAQAQAVATAQTAPAAASAAPPRPPQPPAGPATAQPTQPGGTPATPQPAPPADGAQTPVSTGQPQAGPDISPTAMA